VRRAAGDEHAGGRQMTASSEPGHELISNNERSVPTILPLFPSDPPFSETSDARARSLLPKWVRSTAGGRARSTVGGSVSSAAAGARMRTRKPWPQGIESRLTGLDEFHDRAAISLTNGFGENSLDLVAQYSNGRTNGGEKE
jgi:hypothetical protein